jgi:hypothetical protein
MSTVIKCPRCGRGNLMPKGHDYWVCSRPGCDLISARVNRLNMVLISYKYREGGENGNERLSKMN